MTCKEFRKFVYAFADGELETKENLESLEHLNMCPRCCRKVALQQELRRRVATLYRDEAASPELQARLALALAGDSGIRLAPRRLLWTLVPLATAAALALLVWPRNEVTRASAITDALVRRHVQCRHHERDFESGAKAGTVLAARLDMPVCAPDLDDLGFAFGGADACHVPGHDGTHLFYRGTGARNLVVSVFSVRPRLDLAAWDRAEPDPDHTFHVARNGQFALVAWDCPKASHLVCAECPPEELYALAARAQAEQQSPPPAVAAVTMWTSFAP